MPAKKQQQSASALNPGARMLPVPAAAQYLGTTQWFIRTQCWEYRRKTGEGLPFLILGKRIVIDRADLDKFIEKQKAAAA
jgi:hypothetical protein